MPAAAAAAVVVVAVVVLDLAIPAVVEVLAMEVAVVRAYAGGSGKENCRDSFCSQAEWMMHIDG